jgi:hypothetical protein
VGKIAGRTVRVEDIGDAILPTLRSSFRANGHRRPRSRDCPAKKFAAMTESFLVDAVPNTGGEVPFHRNAKFGKPTRRQE